MASRNRFFRHLRLRLARRHKHRAARPSVRHAAAAQRRSAPALFQRFGGAQAARAGLAGAFGPMPDDLSMVYAIIGRTGAAATRNLIDSFLAASRRYLCL